MTARPWLAVALAVLLAPPAHAATPRDLLVIAESMSNLLTLDPSNGGELESAEVISNLYDRPVDLDPGAGDRVVPRLAESWAVDDDGTLDMMSNPNNTATSKIRRQVWRTGFQNAEANRLMDRLREPIGDAEEMAAIRRLQQIFIDDAWPFLLIARRADPIAVRRTVAGLVPSAAWITRWDVVAKP